MQDLKTTPILHLGNGSVPVSTSPRYPGWRFAEKPADPFKPDDGSSTEVELLWYSGKVPVIELSQLALTKMYIIVEAIDLEVGWLGTSRREGDIFKVDDVYLIGQDVSFGHSELTEDDLNVFITDALTRPEGEYIFNNTRLWGHSHGNGGTSPSSQDDRQMNLFKENGASFFLRVIANRSGDLSFSIYDWKRGYIFHNAQWTVSEKGQLSEVEYLELRGTLRTEMKRKVIHAPPPPPPPRPPRAPFSRRSLDHVYSPGLVTRLLKIYGINLRGE